METTEEYAARMETPESQAALGLLMACAKHDIRMPKRDDPKIDLILRLYVDVAADSQFRA